MRVQPHRQIIERGTPKLLGGRVRAWTPFEACPPRFRNNRLLSGRQLYPDSVLCFATAFPLPGYRRERYRTLSHRRLGNAAVGDGEDVTPSEFVFE